MFYASSRRTESNPITAAAMRAQRLREEARKAPVVPKLAPLVKLALVVRPEPKPLKKVLANERPFSISDELIRQRVNLKWSVFLQEVAQAATTQTADVYRPDIATIVRRICGAFRVSPCDVLSRSRRVDLIMPRQAVYYWTLRLTPLGCTEIGRKLGGRDHSTIIYGVRNYREKRQYAGRFLRPVRRKR